MCGPPLRLSRSDADRAAALRSCHREAPELHAEHGRPLRGVDLCRRPHHGGELPGNLNRIATFSSNPRVLLNSSVQPSF